MPRSAMQMKGHRWAAAVYDRLNAPGDRDTREELAGGAAGKVLEIGAGTGLNFPYYTDRAEEILAIEPDRHMLKRAAGRAEHARRPIEDLRTSPAPAYQVSRVHGSCRQRHSVLDWKPLGVISGVP